MQAFMVQRVRRIYIRSEVKSLFALFIHRSSKRTATPFVRRGQDGPPDKIDQKKSTGEPDQTESKTIGGTDQG